jgi:hypothetical protein
MRNLGLFLIAAALAAGALVWSSGANALLITVNAGASPAFPPTFETIGTGNGSVAVPSTAVGSWSVEATAVGTPPLSSGSLDSNTIDVQSTGPGTLIVWVTEQGLTSPLGNVNFTSGLTTDILEGGISSATLSTFFSPTDGVSPPNGTPLDSHLFTAIGTESLDTTANPGAGPYSLQEVYVIHATGAGNANLTIDLTSTALPEPASLALLGSALVGFGVIAAAARTHKAIRRSFLQTGVSG